MTEIMTTSKLHLEIIVCGDAFMKITNASAVYVLSRNGCGKSSFFPPAVSSAEKEKMVRIVERSEIPHLARLYEQHDLPYEVKNGGDDESINFPSFLNCKNKSVFVSYDSILLNTAEIFSYFQDELAFFTCVNVFRNKNIGGLNSIESGVIFLMKINACTTR